MQESSGEQKKFFDPVHTLWHTWYTQLEAILTLDFFFLVRAEHTLYLLWEVWDQQQICSYG